MLLDRAIFQADPGYLGKAQEYERILRQRNRLLRDQRTTVELETWNLSLARSGARLRQERFKYLGRILPHFRWSYENICGGCETADFEYREGGTDLAELEARLLRELTSRTEAERRMATTLVGPHRDDPFFLVNGIPVKPFASQGQQRSLILAFKTAQVIDLEQRTGETPILLLDDLTGELDRRRQEFFFRFLLQRQGQVFISTTDPEPLVKEGFAKACRFHVSAGTVAAG
jgi:DNA replication and repair protein RecF